MSTPNPSDMDDLLVRGDDTTDGDDVVGHGYTRGRSAPEEPDTPGIAMNTPDDEDDVEGHGYTRGRH